MLASQPRPHPKSLPHRDELCEERSEEAILPTAISHLSGSSLYTVGFVHKVSGSIQRCLISYM